MHPFAVALCSATTGRHVLKIQLANTFLQRLRGLMFSKNLPEQQGLLLKKCSSVHTGFMRYAIDVLYLDGEGNVLKCVANLRPWRASSSGVNWLESRRLGGVDTLELPAGSIERMRLMVGDRLEMTSLERHGDASMAMRRQRGAAMTEFVVVGPAVTLLGLAIIQYGMLFNAKSMMNHASFMAARAGSYANADLTKIRTAYTAALIPLYGGGKDTTSRATALANATTDTAAALRIEILNPTKESFDDWNDPALQTALKTGAKRVIPNGNLAFKLGDAASAKTLGTDKTFKVINGANVKKSSGQSLTDANLLKLRVTQGYKPKVPLMGLIYTKFLQWLDNKSDAFQTALIADGRVPIITNVTVQMQSDAIEGSPVSFPGEGNHGTPKDPGTPPETTEPPPKCASMGCTTENPPTPADPGGGGDGSGHCTGTDCPKPDCNKTNVEQVLSADALFNFDKSSLSDLLPGGTEQLDKLIEYAKTHHPTSAVVTGYTDQLGTDAHNLKLSEDRAKTVRDYLKAHGFPDIPITVVGKGSADPVKPLSECPPPSDREAQIKCLQPNRRVVVQLQGVDA